MGGYASHKFKASLSIRHTEWLGGKGILLPMQEAGCVLGKKIPWVREMATTLMLTGRGAWRI